MSGRRGLARRWLVVSPWIALGLVLAGPARGAPAAATAAAKAEARERFDKGLWLFDKGDKASALAEFKRANEIMPNPLVLYNMGLVYAAMNRPVEAVDALTGFLAQAGNAQREQRHRAEQVSNEQAARIARLALTTEVPATVEIDGVEVGHTPLAEPLRLPSGTHVVAVTAPGFLPSRKEVTLAGQMTETLALRLLPAESRMAQLVVTSVPQGAEVIVNGNRAGTTPLPASVAVSPGTAQVEVRRKGYLPATRTLALGEGAHGELAFSLAEDPRAPPASKGVLRINLSEPDTEVWVDGVPRKDASRGLLLPEGPHDLKVERPGFEPYQHTVNLTAGSQTPLALTLVPTPDTLMQYEGSVRTRRVVGWTVLGAGAALTIAGGVYGVVQLGDVNDARSSLDSVLANERDAYNPCYAQSPDYQARGCDAIKTTAQDRVDSAVLRRNLGFVGAGVGVLVAGLGTYVLLTSGDANRYRKPAGVALTEGTLWTDGEAKGVALTGRF
jgi:hypothetical protein